MGLLDGYADSIERNALSDARRGLAGPAPDPSFSLSAAGASLGKAVPAGLLEGFGAIRDFSSAIDQRHAEEVRAREKRLGLDPSAPYIIPGGGVFRKKADEFAPDPLTAHAAQQLTFGFAKSLTKAGASMVAAGPTGGALLFGLGEADDTAQRLMDKGIDSSTAWQVGGVVGLTSAIGARLPISGAAMAETVAGKVAATAALGVAGGPVSYMAQEGLAREILQRAGHEDEAKLHDPTNPIGLGASLFPLVLGGFAVRGAIKRIGPVKTEAAAREAMALTPAEQAHSDAFERSAGNLAELRQEIARTKDPAAKQVLLAELDKQTKAAAGEVRGTAAARAAEHPEAVDAARVSVLDETVARSLPDSPIAHAEMLRAADMVAAGERVDVMGVNPWDMPRTIADVAPAAQMDVELRGMATGAYWAQQGGRLLRDGIDQPGDGGSGGFVVGRTPWVPAEEWFGRMRQQLGADGLSRQEDIAAAVEKAISGEKLRAAERRTIDWMRTEVDQMRIEAQRAGFDEFDAHALANEGMAAGLGQPDAADLTLTARAAKIDEAAVERAAIQHESDDAAFMAEIRRIITDAGQDPTAEVKAPSTGARGAGDGAPQERTGNTLPEAGQVGLKPDAGQAASARADGAPSAEQQAAQSLAEQNPDMPVRLPGEDKNTTLAAALERIKEERAYAEQEAELYRVAVQCALTAGAAI